MNKNLAGSFLVLIFIFGIFGSANVRAFGEFETNQYQAAGYDWIKAIFGGNLYSISPPASGCTEKYVGTVTGAAKSFIYYPIGVNCQSSSYSSNYFCKAYTVLYYSDGSKYYLQDSNGKLYSKINGGQSVTYGWYGAPSQTLQQYVIDYYDWSCPNPNPQCTGSYGVQKCSGTQRIYEQCDGMGNLKTQTLETCASGTTCAVNNGVSSCVQSQPSCAPNWQTGAWYPTTCPSDGKQTRNVWDSNNCANPSGMPSGIQSCTYTAPPPSCAPNWQTGAWGECQPNNQQTRSVTDSNNCGTTANKPSDTQGCNYVPPFVKVCDEGAKQLNSCPDGTTYDYKVCRNNNWEVIPYVTSPCQKASNCPMFVPPKECGQNEKSVIVKAGYVDSNGCNIAAETKCEPIAPTLDGSTTAILAIGGLSALIVGMVWWLVRKKK